MACKLHNGLHSVGLTIPRVCNEESTGEVFLCLMARLGLHIVKMLKVGCIFIDKTYIPSMLIECNITNFNVTIYLRKRHCCIVSGHTVSGLYKAIVVAPPLNGAAQPRTSHRGRWTIPKEKIIKHTKITNLTHYIARVSPLTQSLERGP